MFCVTPKLFSYVTMGELCALTIGWNLVLSYVVGTSSVAKAWSANIDALINCKLRAWQVSFMPYMQSKYMEDYPDIFAAIIIIVLAGNDEYVLGPLSDYNENHGPLISTNTPCRNSIQTSGLTKNDFGMYPDFNPIKKFFPIFFRFQIGISDEKFIQFRFHRNQFSIRNSDFSVPTSNPDHDLQLF